jgi:hypothetical protein
VGWAAPCIPFESICTTPVQIAVAFTITDDVTVNVCAFRCDSRLAGISGWSSGEKYLWCYYVQYRCCASGLVPT